MKDPPHSCENKRDVENSMFMEESEHTPLGRAASMSPNLWCAKKEQTPAAVTELFCPHRYQRDGELGPPGNGELRPDQTLDPHDDIFHHLLHVSENPARRSSDQHLLRGCRGTPFYLWETLQVCEDKLAVHFLASELQDTS